MDAPERRPPDLFKPTLVAGIAFGVAAGLPGTSLLNLCLCAPAWGAGIGAAFLHGRACREAGFPFTPGEGARIGFLSGVIYALAATTVFLVLLAAMGGSEGLLREVEQTSDQIPWFSQELMEWMRGLARSGWLPGVMGASLFVMHLVAGGVFSTLGGLLGAAMLRRPPR
ncbi:MAG TPA: hypothetical protein VFV75_18865 [Candidatus Polarisedimenticolaceae bacterium]|nr:hypothetical protein [Candidatus Polarisedimenticolaceae bacterium]